MLNKFFIVNKTIINFYIKNSIIFRDFELYKLDICKVVKI